MLHEAEGVIEQTERLLGGPETRPPVAPWRIQDEEEDAANAGDVGNYHATWSAPRTAASRRWRHSIFVPVLTVLTAAAVITALFLLLDALARQTGPLATKGMATTLAGGSCAPNRGQAAIFLHPEEHMHRRAKTIRMSWNITKGRWDPDGVYRDVVHINGQFPGPTIEARTGDTLSIEITNSMNESTSLHWHGLHMRGANHMDGPVGVNQCAIPPGASLVYKVPTGDQAGTFWYHAHAEVQRADGLYGGLVVHRPAAGDDTVLDAGHNSGGYDKDLLLLVGDWFHFAAESVFSVFEDPSSNGNEPCPDSVLVNGMGTYDCDRATPAAPVDCRSVPMPSMMLDKTLRYRVRLVNVGSLAGISTTVLDGEIRVIAVDGGLPVVLPRGANTANSVGVVYPAQRVDYVLSWPDAASAYTDTELVVDADGEYYVGDRLSPPSRRVRIAAVPAASGSTATATLEPRSVLQAETAATVAVRSADLRAARGPTLTTPLPAPERVYMIFAVMEILSHNRYVPKGYINHTTWVPQDLPLLGLDRSAWDSHQLVPWTGNRTGGTTSTGSAADSTDGARDGGVSAWVELTINNIDTQGHPFHLHGFDFHVVASHEGLGGWDYYNPFLVPWKPPRGTTVNVADPPQRDTVYVPPYGYVILRFRADNEGIWVLHCHILWHQASGMSMAFQVLGDEHGLSTNPAGKGAAEYCKSRGQR